MNSALAAQTGILTSRQLTHAGWSQWQIEVAVRTGELTRVRPGWFAQSLHDAAALTAVKAGGSVSCFSALSLHGVWVPEGKGQHVRLPKHRRRKLRVRRCSPFGEQPAVTSAVDELETALRCVLRCGSREEIVVVLDSILHEGLATRDELEAWMSEAPARVTALLEVADGRSESGSESMVRFRLCSSQIATRIQVWVAEGIRVDLLIGERLIVECDSRAHHTDSSAYESDRRRDRLLSANGFIVLRLSYRQIHDEWLQIEQDILAIVRRGGHRWPRRRKIRA